MNRKIMCLVFLLLVLPIIAIADNLQITYINVGQGDAALLQCGGQSMLIDTGSDASQEALLAFLDQANVVALDYLVGTHPHDDHIGGFDEILSKYDVQAVWMPRVKNETKTFDAALLAIRQSGHLIDPPVAGNEIMLGDAVVTILGPISDVYENLDDYSIVIRVDHGKNSFLFPGDAGQVSMDEMLASKSAISASVLKVSNHGAAISSFPRFLTEVSPTIAIISSDPSNKPAKATLDALEKAGVFVLRTDEEGNIQIESDRTTIFYDQKPAMGEDEWYGKINIKNVNVRKGPSKRSDRIAYFDEGTAVSVLLTVENDNNETWYLIEMDGIQGYVLSDFVDPVNPLAYNTQTEEGEDYIDELDEYFSPKSSPSTAPQVTEEPLVTAPPATAEPTTTERTVSSLPTIPVPTVNSTSPSTSSQSTEPPVPTQPPQAQFVGNIISRIFHVDTCDSLPSQKNRITFGTRSEAIQAGYIPCLSCNP